MAIYTKSVTTTIVHGQSFSKFMPKITTSLSHGQTIVGVLPKVTTVLTHSQTIRCSIKYASVQTTLRHSQSFNTDDSILDEAEVIEETLTASMTIALTKTNTKTVTTSLTHSQEVIGVVVNDQSEDIWGST